MVQDLKALFKYAALPKERPKRGGVDEGGMMSRN